MNTVKTMSAEMSDDSALVAASLTGDRTAFGQIVARYQSLVCSVAYSATGSLTLSEDLAQETFVTAWQRLGDLREPAKLRAWLCGIARNLLHHTLRKLGREPAQAADTLDAVRELAAPDEPPAGHAIRREEEAILWRSLERIPALYREPLILFYREHRSVEQTAALLDLSEDTVKQRLSRGRKLLAEEVTAFVEGALQHTAPGPAFMPGVLSALPALAAAGNSGAIGVAAAKGGATAKAAGALGWFGALLSPLLAVFGNYASYRMSMDEAESDEERGHVKKLFKYSLVATLVISAVLALPLYGIFRGQNDPAVFWGMLCTQTVVIYFLTVLVFGLFSLPARRRMLAGILARDCAGAFPPAAYEFRSRPRLLGLPLLHVRLGDRFDVMRGPVKAWIAIGSSHAVGVLFASGGIAVAPVCFGGVAIGLLPFGAISLGVISIGAIGLGLWSYGALAAGWQVFGGGAFGWNAAMGALACAHDFALGAVAHAAQANNESARQFFQQNLFFRCAQVLSNHGLLLMLAWVIPVTLMSRVVARARHRAEMKNSPTAA